MHDTALEIGRLAIEIYASKDAKILELGSMDVNGSLRQFAPEDSSYLGVDLEPGKSVDMVVEPGKPLPFEDGAFDLILASSVFEHDPAFWATFLDLARLLRDGGHLYINAPSNGAVHRYPEDHWRFYPDSGLALERWATSQGLPVRLIESFTAPRKGDTWNDFVAIFRRGESEAGLKGRFLHTVFDGKNVWTLGASKPLKPSDPTEDMLLLKGAQEKSSKLEKEVGEIRAKIERISQDAHTLESTLRQREEEIEQVTRERSQLEQGAKAKQNELGERLETLQQERDAARNALATTEARLEEQGKALAHQQAETIRHETAKAEALAELAVNQAKLFASEARLNEREESLAKLKAKAKKARKAHREVEGSLEERFSELATLTRLLNAAENGGRDADARRKTSESQRLAAEARSRAEAENRAWLVRVHAHLAEMRFWTALLPPPYREQRRLKVMRSAGLFDAEKYLELYPDVVAAGMDPLRHYILHGMEEGRERPV
ncbi:methyltransferase domain-containing protein [Erythrobacter sanguineus]|uniref:Methyltransferase domain-containing protein n=1 Tax=Erythrobacter sanguineus TaxID=198312 RepID=A0A1M7T2D5_9SPHN|nr:methyltransferase domain-containing protein [Erythrobacter sanguineus]SHN64930.1 Methyltransferase domain-containing protein [Erythrobacter sanguineus]